MIGQAEHGELSQCILISKNKKIIDEVKKELRRQLKEIPRSKIAAKSLKDYGILMYVKSDKKIIEIINKIGPEHLELNIKNFKTYLPKIKNAASVACGKYAVMALTDYGAPLGQNHILPTNNSSKYSSGLSVSDFKKKISYVNISKKGIETLGPSVITLAKYEGLIGHALSVKKRIRRK